MTIGREDNFFNDGLENASPSQALLNWQIFKGGTSINAGFDNLTPNSWFSHTFTGLNQIAKGGTLVGANLQLGIQALADFSENDNLHLGFINSNTDNFIYGSRIGKDGDAFSILNASWVAGSKTDLFFNLDSLPPNWQNTSSLIAEMQNQGKLDLFIQDDTSVDYLRLNLHYLGTDNNDTFRGFDGHDTLEGGNGNDTLDGGDGNDSIIGGDGNDYIYGINGDDTLIGGSGNDYFWVDSPNDQISDSAGIDNVYSYITWSLENYPDFENLLLRGTNNINATGNMGNNAIYGNDGNNILNGGSGNDILTGGIGLDSFQFNSSSEGVDRIYDFVVADDTIVISAAGFSGGLSAGVLDASQFKLGTSATLATTRFGYNSSTGSLWFDADGSGATAAVQFATLNTGLALTNADIVVF